MPTELVELPGGEFAMGSTSFYPEEAPIHLVTVAPFAIERYPVTNAQFAEFVDATGYVTVAERPLDPTLYPGVAQEDLLPGALIFRPTASPVNLSDWRQWWDWAPGAHWRCPYGVGSDIADRLDHPVVQIAYPDAAAYAAWAGRRLPLEVEWEMAAETASRRGFRWGDVWEWTASTFRPYPGFVPGPDAAYSQAWFGRAKVLRGGSTATRTRLKSPRFRRFAEPAQDQLFCGFRSCAL